MKSTRHLSVARGMGRCLLLLLVAHHAHAADRECVLPSKWHGNWFHSGVTGPVVVTNTKISFKGVCVMSDDRQRYLFQDETHDCYRCLVMHMQHDNVLQYKETYCDALNDDLLYVCSLLTGDALLHSMFRIDSKPIPCPFPDSYTFVYTRGHSECLYPLSTVDSCNVEHKVLFRYQACPDIQGTESTQEELTCLGVWKEGSNYYLVGKSDNQRATTDEDRYQCFVYRDWTNDTESGFMMAQSGDATCYGLYSVSGGSMTMLLTRVDTSGTKCRFPMWLDVGSNWTSLDGHTVMQVSRRNSTLRLVTSHTSEHVTHSCFKPYVHTKHSATYITRVVHGCTSGYECVHMLARDKHVLEILMGKMTPVSREACDINNFNPSSTNFTTFVSDKAESRRCPGMGRYKVVFYNNVIKIKVEPDYVSQSFPYDMRDEEGEMMACGLGVSTHLDVGCSTTDTLSISNTCSSREFSCHGSWQDGGRQYLVVTPISRSSMGVRRICFVLEQGAGMLSIASSTVSCGRNLTPGVHGFFALNTTSIGGCRALPVMDGSGSGVKHTSSLPLLLSLLLLLFVLPHSAPAPHSAARWCC